ncbi:MAG: helix-hairpin-helix domain-containing protein [Bifidobacterium crudilactis]|nr:helix-hairpin-helix domain-containing protein [Bifidobacterium crudilactis]
MVAFRRERGRFNAVDELLDISGIGIKKLEGIRPYVRVG